MVGGEGGGVNVRTWLSVDECYLIKRNIGAEQAAVIYALDPVGKRKGSCDHSLPYPPPYSHFGGGYG
jgi:hypothetical protein